MSAQYSVGILGAMADTTIKVDSAVRDRLAVLAGERGTTIRDLVQHLAEATPTQAERHQRREQALDYVRTHLIPDFTDEDVDAGARTWEELRAGTLTIAPPPASDQGGRDS